MELLTGGSLTDRLARARSHRAPPPPSARSSPARSSTRMSTVCSIAT